MTGSSNRSAHPFAGYALVLIAATCWATGGLMAKWLFTAAGPATADWPLPPLGIDISPQALSGGRSLIAFVILVPLLALFSRKDLAVRSKELPFFAAFGILGLAMVHFTYFMTISLTNASTAILLEYLAPVLVFIFAVLFQGERSGWRLPAGVGLSLVGCMFVVGAFSPGGLVVSPAGIAWGLASAVAFATYSLFGARAAGRYSPYKTLVWGLGFAALFWLVVLGPDAVLSPLADARTLAAVACMAVVSTIIPFSAFLKALTLIPPTHATTTSTLEPFVVALGEFLLFRASITTSQIVGGVFVVGAIMLIQSTSKKKNAPVFPPLD